MRRWVGLAFVASLCHLLLLAPTTATVWSQEHDEATATESAAKEDADAGNGEAETPEAAEEEHGDETHASGGGHGDPTDLGHQNAGEKLEDPTEFKSDLAIWTFVVFLCLLALLLKFAWGPVMEGLEKRETSIAAMIDEAKQSADKAAEQLRQYEARLAQAGEEAQELIVQAKRDAESVTDQIVAEAQAAAKRERLRAVQDIESAKNSALEQMTQHSVDLAVLMAGRIVQRQIKPEDHARLIREALDQLPSRN